MTIEYAATIGQQVKRIKISDINGAEGWHVYLDAYYQGSVDRVRGVLVAHFNDKLQGDDIAAILEVVERNWPG